MKREQKFKPQSKSPKKNKSHKEKGSVLFNDKTEPF